MTFLLSKDWIWLSVFLWLLWLIESTDILATSFIFSSVVCDFSLLGFMGHG